MIVLFVSATSLLISCVLDLSISYRGVLESQWTGLFLLVILSIFASQILTLLLGPFLLNTVMASWGIDPFIIMYVPYLSLIIFFARFCSRKARAHPRRIRL